MLDCGAEARRPAGGDHRGSGAVAEQARGGLVVGVDDPAHDLGPDHEDGVRAAGLHEARRQRERGDEPGTGSANVDPADERRSQLGRNLRRRVRKDLVLRRGGHEHEVERSRLYVRALERLSARIGREGSEGRARCRAAALLDPGAGLQPPLVHTEPAGDRLAGDDIGRQGHPEPGDARRSEARWRPVGGQERARARVLT